jgi:hypothetical protein
MESHYRRCRRAAICSLLRTLYFHMQGLGTAAIRLVGRYLHDLHPSRRQSEIPTHVWQLVGPLLAWFGAAIGLTCTHNGKMAVCTLGINTPRSKPRGDTISVSWTVCKTLRNQGYLTHQLQLSVVKAGNAVKSVQSVPLKLPPKKVCT